MTIQNTLLKILLPLILLWSIKQAYCQDKLNEIEKLFTYYHKNKIFNGNVLIAEKGEIIYHKSFGFTELKDSIPLGKNTAFSLASITKPFVAMGIMVLKEEDKLEYSDELKKYFPQLPEFLHSITIKNLLQHTSGLARGHFKVDDRLRNEALLERLMKTDSLDYKTGSRLKYSNSAYILLAMIIEKVSNQTFGQFMKEAVFDPLGMTCTFLFDKEEQEYKDIAIGYDGFGNKSDYDLTTYGSAGIYSTTEDLLKWSRELSKNSIITQETITEALIPSKSPKGEILDLSIGGIKVGYGLGFFIFKDKLEGIVGHSGAYGGFYNILVKDLNYDREVIILTNNGRSFSIFDLSATIQNILNNRPYQLPKISTDVIFKDYFNSIEDGIVYYSELKKTAKKKYDFGNESGLNKLGYGLISKNKIKSAIKVFELFVSEFPESFRPYHGLGKAYYLDEQYKLSLKNYQKSFDLNKNNSIAKKMIAEIKKLTTTKAPMKSLNPVP